MSAEGKGEEEMSEETYIVNCRDELIKAFKYATRLLENAKFGIIVRISLKRLKRSIKQNAYYRGVIVGKIADQQGFPVHERHKVHEALKDMFCPEKEVAFGRKVRSTTLLNTEEMEKYHEDIRLWYLDFAEYMLPLPNEVPDKK